MALEKKRNFFKESILKSSKFLNGMTDDVTEFDVSTQYDRCTEAWRTFQDVHLEILQVTGDEFIEFQNIEFDAVEAIVMEIIPRFKLLLSKFDGKRDEIYESAHASVLSKNDGNDVISYNNGGLRVPFFKIPLFSGNYDAWPAFKDLFRSMIHFNNKMSPVQKLGYLKVNLTGEALQIVKNLEITDVNYDTAWRLLTDRYDNERILVNRWIQLIFSIPVSKGEAADIKAILDGTQEALQGLKNLNRPIEYYDDFLIYLTESKLDQKSKQRWEDEIAEVQNTAPKWEQMATFLKTRFRSLEVYHVQVISSQQKSSNQPNNTKPPTPPKSSSESTSKSNQDDLCLFCKKKHRLNVCFAFQKIPFNERQTFVEEKKICPNCLSIGHKVASCPSTYTCRVCQQRHHTLLHVTKQSSHMTVTRHLSETECQRESQFLTLLATALVVVNIKGVKIQLRALIDQGSQVSFITCYAAKRLGLRGQTGGPAIQTVGAKSFLATKGTIQLNFSSTFNEDCVYQTTVTILDKITGQLPSDFINIKLPKSWKKITLADPHFYEPGPIDALFGADVLAEILENGFLKMTTHQVIAQKTTLGWLLSGKVKLTNPIPVAMTGVLTNADEDFEKFSQQLQTFWNIENVGPDRILDADDQFCEEHFLTTHYRDESGRFVVRLPFKPNFRDVIRLGNSRNMAIYNWLSTERRMVKSPELRSKYTTIMDKLIENKYMVPVPPSELQVPPDESCYLVHHIVRRGEKDRIVFNASKKTSSGFSLNDALLVGPPLQKDLFSIILHVRQFRIAFSTDVVKMFRQYLINERDVDFQRFVYRKSPSDEIQDFPLVTVLDGTACASYLANKIIQTLAEDERYRFPLACAIAERDIYVDDLFSGCHDIASALETRDQLISLLDSLPHELLETPIELGEDDVIKTLGIFWSPHKDEFHYRIRMNEVQSQLTKRQLLSEASKLFDPVGWVAPCIIIPKILFQSLWSTKLNWDDPLPKDVEEKWLRFRGQLPYLEKLKIPRWTGNSKNSNLIELHGFSDASEKAYAAVVYIKLVDVDGNISVHLLTAKTKVAPIKTISLPRLELCGALLLAHLLERAVKAMQFGKVSVHAHTDSQIVLAWLQSKPSRWKTFVANRTSEILRIIPAERWHHVRSEDNPADCASRGVDPSQLENHTLWWHGPIWLQLSTERWTLSEQSIELDSTTNMEERKSVLVLANFVQPTWDIRTKYSSLTKLMRVSHLLAFH